MRSKSEGFVEEDEELRHKLDRDAASVQDYREDPYSFLPVAIKQIYSRAEYMWLSDREKATLVERECDPEA